MPENWGDFHKVYHSDDYKNSAKNQANLVKKRGTLSNAGASLLDMAGTSMRDLLKKQSSSSDLQREGLRRENSSSSLNGSGQKPNQRTKRGCLRRVNSAENLNVPTERVTRPRRGGLRKQNSYNALDRSAIARSRGLRRENSSNSLDKSAVARGTGLRRENSSNALDKSAAVPRRGVRRVKSSDAHEPNAAASRRGLRKQNSCNSLHKLAASAARQKEKTSSIQNNPSNNTGRRGMLNRAKSQPMLLKKMLPASDNKNTEKSSDNRRSSLAYIDQPAGENPESRLSFNGEKRNSENSRGRNYYSEPFNLDVDQNDDESVNDSNNSSVSSHFEDVSARRLADDLDDRPAAVEVESDQSSGTETDYGCSSSPADERPEENQGEDVEAFFSSVWTKLDDQSNSEEFTDTNRKTNYKSKTKATKKRMF